MSWTVGAYDLSKITLCENDTVRSILQNIRTILRTPKFTVPLYREFGLDVNVVDSPITVAEPILYAEVREAIEQFEPRCTVTDISFVIEKNNPGALTPRVEVEINAGAV